MKFPSIVAVSLAVTTMSAGLSIATPAQARQNLATQNQSAATTPRGDFPSIVAAYSLVAPTSASKSNLVARAIVKAGRSCPTLNVSNGAVARQLKMSKRSPGRTALPGFSTYTVCTKSIPRGSKRASIAAHTIPASMPTSIKKLAMVADTGCRVLSPEFQDCLSPTQWPMKAISRSIAAQRPQIILNPGDYYYREGPCPPAEQALCAGTPPPVPGMPFTDSDKGWVADVVAPMSPLFKVAPLLLARGNHEACDRAGNGFFLFFDPRPNSAAACAPIQTSGGLVAPPPATTPTWAVTLRVNARRTLRVAMVDSAYGEDDKISSWAPTQRTSYLQAKSLTPAAKGRESWLMTHRPTFGHGSTTLAPSDPKWTPWVSLDQTAASYGLLGTYSMLLSSHVHLTQSVQIPGQPGSLIIGNGGTSLEPPTGYANPPFGPLAKADGAPVSPDYTPYPAATNDWTQVAFGYAIATPGKASQSWSIVHRSPSGKRTGQCAKVGRTIACS